MKPGIKRTMRVATTFTGAAACAVAFNPAAMAATGPPAAQADHQQQLRRFAIAGNTRLSGSIRESAGCDGANVSHWLHVSEGPGFGAVCFGYRGLLLTSPYPDMKAFCGGNNSGYIWGTDNVHSYTVYYHFGHGTYYYKPPKSEKYFYVSEIGIAGWKGSDKCPY
jgi:hypothetical protein